MAPAPTTRIRMGLSLLLILFFSPWRNPAPIPPTANCRTSRSPSLSPNAIRWLWVLAFARTTSKTLFGFPPSKKSLPRDHLLDLAQLFLAEEHLAADEEGRRAERPACDGLLGVLDQSALHLGFPGAGEQLLRVEAGGRQRLGRDFRIVHLLRLAPHVVEGGLDVCFEYAFELRRDRRAHQVQRVDREEGIPGIGLHLEALDEALGLDRLEFPLVLDAGKRLGRRLVVGRLEDTPEQDRHVLELDADALLDGGNREMTEIGVRTAEIEQELRGCAGQNHPP